MKKDLTEIIFILDESGSMSSVKGDTIGGFNEFIEAQKRIPGTVKFTFVKFSDYYNVINEGTPIEEVSPLNESTYTPSFSTALLDAVGKAVNSVTARLDETPEDEKPEKVLFAILTDGYENASTEYAQKAINEMIKNQRTKEGWEFLFLGADIDAWSGGSAMGINMNINISKNDLKRSMKGMSYYAASYRTNNLVGMSADTFNLSEEELDKKMEELQDES
ncbi:MAG TPA: vWA domain-containing protein [Candidatus Paceibacterota bacterium]|nr:vWA domain-containing protein [Candidatus Paceibacterota bacterium]